MDTANPLANQSTIALVLLHQYVDSDPYRALDPGRRALVQEAIENLTAFEESGPTWPSPPADAPARDRESSTRDSVAPTRDRESSTRDHESPTRDNGSPTRTRVSLTRSRISPTGAGDRSNRAAAADDLITDFRVS